MSSEDHLCFEENLVTWAIKSKRPHTETSYTMSKISLSFYKLLVSGIYNDRKLINMVRWETLQQRMIL